MSTYKFEELESVFAANREYERKVKALFSQIPDRYKPDRIYVGSSDHISAIWGDERNDDSYYKDENYIKLFTYAPWTWGWCRGTNDWHRGQTTEYLTVEFLQVLAETVKFNQRFSSFEDFKRKRKQLEDKVFGFIKALPEGYEPSEIEELSEREIELRWGEVGSIFVVLQPNEEWYWQSREKASLNKGHTPDEEFLSVLKSLVDEHLKLKLEECISEFESARFN